MQNNIDDFVKSRKTPFFVIPAEAGIQSFQTVTDGLDSGFHRSDGFLRVHQCWNNEIMGLKAWSMGQGAKSLEEKITLCSTLPAPCF